MSGENKLSRRVLPADKRRLLQFETQPHAKGRLVNMNTSPTTRDEAPVPSAPPVRLEEIARDDRASRELTVVGELLASLETLTIAGQRYAMAKIVAVAHDQVARVTPAVSARNRAVLGQLLDDLRREAARLLPDVGAFTRRATTLTALLAALA